MISEKGRSPVEPPDIKLFYNKYIKSNYFSLKIFIKKPIYLESNYLKPIDACQTNASNKKKKGIDGNTSTIGLKTE